MCINRFSFMFLVLLGITGCTSTLWQQPAYNEKISGFFLSESDGKRRLVAEGQEFAYLFEEVSEDLWVALINSKEISFRPWLEDWSLNADSSVAGTLTLYASGSDVNYEQESHMLEYGFLKSNPDKSVLTSFKLETSLKGIAIPNSRNSQVHLLQKPIHLRIKRPRTSNDITSSAALTPEGLLYDAIILPVVVVGFGVAAALNETGL